jgi:hypothetical protein
MISQSELKEILNFNPKTGIFTRKITVRYNAKIGDEPGWIDNNGYRVMEIETHRYFAHRLAWFYVYGVWPKNEIDHIDHNGSNNKIDNLREATRSQNNQNRIKAQTFNSTGMIGVSFHKSAKKYSAQIRVNNKNKYLGLFLTPEEAHAAYIAAKREFHPFGIL